MLIKQRKPLVSGSCIAVIPARGGSKRIPRKNIRSFDGKPMIAYAIDAAHNSMMFDHIVVSTDDEEIGAISREYGAETPFIRPLSLADDHTPTVPVVSHAIGACRDLGWKIDYVCCVYPCVPFIKVDELRASFDLLRSSDASFSFPVAEFPSVIQRALRRSTDARMAPIHPEYEQSRSQDLEPAYFDAGQFYWASTETWLRENIRVHSDSVGLLIPSWRVVDIDTPEDWEKAELTRRILK